MPGLCNLSTKRHIPASRRYGLHTSDEAVCFVVDTLKKTIGEQADIYRVSAQEFVCIANKNILPYVSQFMDFMSFENKDRCCKVHVAVGYEVYNSRRHKSIDDLLKSCELKMRKEKIKGFELVFLEVILLERKRHQNKT